MKKKIWLYLISGIAGVINGMFSTGAGLVLIPGLIYLIKIEELRARGTALVIIESICIINLIIYSHAFSFEMEYLYIIIGGIIGSMVGSNVIYKIKNLWMDIGFAIFTIIMGIGMI